MRGLQLLHHFFGLTEVAWASVLTVCAKVASAATTASRAESHAGLTSPKLCSVTLTPTAPGGWVTPASGTPASSVATPLQQLVQVTTPAATAMAESAMPAGGSTPLDIGVTAIGGGSSAGVPANAIVPSATTTTSVPWEDLVATESVATYPVATRPHDVQSGRLAEFEGLARARATILLARFSIDRAMWRSASLVWRLEHPG